MRHASSSVSRRAGRAACVTALRQRAPPRRPAASAASVKDEAGQPIKGATITAENPNASPSSFTATTDDKGRFSIIGLRTGRWTFTAQAPGFAPEAGELNVQTIGAPNPPLTFTLKKGGTAAPTGALGGVAAKDLQADLAAADQLFNAQQVGRCDRRLPRDHDEGAGAAASSTCRSPPPTATRRTTTTRSPPTTSC